MSHWKSKEHSSKNTVVYLLKYWLLQTREIKILKIKTFPFALLVMLFTSTFSWKNTKAQRHCELLLVWTHFDCTCSIETTTLWALYCENRYFKIDFLTCTCLSLFVSSLFTTLLSDKKLWHKRRMCVFSCVQMFWLSRGHLKSVVYLKPVPCASDHEHPPTYWHLRLCRV